MMRTNIRAEISEQSSFVSTSSNQSLLEFLFVIRISGLFLLHRTRHGTHGKSQHTFPVATVGLIHIVIAVFEGCVTRVGGAI